MDVHEIGNRIKQARLLRNYTLDDIANEIGVAKSTIQRYENGLINKLKLPVLQAIADSLNVNPAWLSGQDVPMIIDESLSSLIRIRLNELNMSLEEVSEKSGVSLHWLQNLDAFIPGQWGNYEIGYDWITKVAEVIDLPASKLRTALARQEIPTYEGPNLTAEEAFRQAREDFKEPLSDEIVKAAISRTEHEHIIKYRYVDEKGKHTVDTVLEMEYSRCKSSNKANVIPIPQKDQSHLVVNAAHDRTDISKEDRTEEAIRREDDIMDDQNF